MLIICELDSSVCETNSNSKNNLLKWKVFSIIKFKNVLCKDYTSRGHAISGKFNVFCPCLEYLEW